MAGLSSQMVPHPGKTSPEIVTEQIRESTSKENNQSTMPPRRVDYSITHALPGRVGFCVPRIAEDPQYVERLQMLLEAERWVIDEQINSAAASIVITYKSRTIPDDQMRSHLASLIQSASNAVVATNSRAATQQPTQDTFNLLSQPQPATPLEEINQTTPPASIEYSIVHAISGRVRFRVPRIAEDPEYVQRLQALLAAERWVTSERVNTTVASIAITYKPGVIPDDQRRLRSMREAHSQLASLIQSAVGVVKTDR